MVMYIHVLSAKLEKDKAEKHSGNNTASNWDGFEFLFYYLTTVLEA